MMPDQERILSEFATLTEGSIAKGFRHVVEKYEWVETKEEAINLMSRFRGILISSLCGEIEECTGISFSKILSQLSDSPDFNTSKFRHQNMTQSSSLRGRAQTMWAIRIAYTHGNGHIRQIDDDEVIDFLPGEHIMGIKIESEKIILTGQETFPAVRTAVEIFEKFK